jgi:hypothetical protein
MRRFPLKISHQAPSALQKGSFESGKQFDQWEKTI